MGHVVDLFKASQLLVNTYQLKVEADIKSGQLLAQKGLDKQLYLYRADHESPVLLEIGRLRESTFRHTGLGTGQFYDLDDYDFCYDHLILWDDIEKMIIGAYRLSPCEAGLREPACGTEPGLYSQTIYQYSPAFISRYFSQTVEIGRIFIRRSHWGTRSLDYLWFGMAHYFALKPELRYFVCALSIPSFFPDYAKQLIVDFYSQQYPDPDQLADSIYPYKNCKGTKQFRNKLGAIDSTAEKYRFLRKALQEIGLPFPMLYKNTEIFEPEGVRFLCFGYDRGFSNACDGLMFADTTKIRQKVLARYTRD